MYPELPAVAGFALKTYALLCGLAMMAAVLPVRAEARRLGWSVEGMTWLVFTTTLVGWAGAHVLYVITRFDLPSEAWWDLVFRVGAGHVWYGGFLLAWVYVHWHARRHGFGVLRMYDVAAFAVLMAQAVGRLGCLFAGCCYGVPSSLAWGVPATTVEYGAARVHPTPLYESLFLAVLMAGLWRGRAQRADGGTAALYLILSASGRFLLEFLRGDTVRGFVWGWLSTSQLVAVLLFGSGFALHAYVRQGLLRAGETAA